MSDEDTEPVNINLVSLLEQVKNHPVIYDNTRSDYTNQSKKKLAWNSVSRIVGRSAARCQRVFHYMRNRFARERRIASETATFSVWPYYEHISFLSDFVRARNSFADTRERNDDLLIETVKKHPILYGRSTKYRQGITKKNAAWKSIGRVLDSSEDTCKRRFAVLRNKFSKIMRNNRTATTEDTLSEQDAEFYEKMRFLEEFVRPRVLYRLGPSSSSSDHKPDCWSDDDDYMTEFNNTSDISQQQQQQQPTSSTNTEIISINPIEIAMGIKQETVNPSQPTYNKDKDNNGSDSGSESEYEYVTDNEQTVTDAAGGDKTTGITFVDISVKDRDVVKGNNRTSEMYSKKKKTATEHENSTFGRVVADDLSKIRSRVILMRTKVKILEVLASAIETDDN